MKVIRSRLDQAAILLLGFPIFIISMHVFRLLTGRPFEPLIIVGFAYCFVAVAVALALIFRKRRAWVCAVIISALCTPISIYMGWHLLSSIFHGTAIPGAALELLVAFHLVFLLSSVVPLGILLTPVARREASSDQLLKQSARVPQ
jgi:hypothetical protein